MKALSPVFRSPCVVEIPLIPLISNAADKANFKIQPERGQIFRPQTLIVAVLMAPPWPLEALLRHD